MTSKAPPPPPPPPPRASLASRKFHPRNTTNPFLLNSSTNDGVGETVNESSAYDEDLSLWVVGYGYRNKAQFRALYHQLSSYGTITARRGGMSSCFFGESNIITTTTATLTDSDSNNWVAVRYESVLCAHKARCQQTTILSVEDGGGFVIVGIIPVVDPNMASKLGIHVVAGAESGGGGGGGVALASTPGRTRYTNHLVLTETNILLDNSYRRDNEDVVRFDSLCGKILAWIFMWE